MYLPSYSLYSLVNLREGRSQPIVLKIDKNIEPTTAIGNLHCFLKKNNLTYYYFHQLLNFFNLKNKEEFYNKLESCYLDDSKPLGYDGKSTTVILSKILEISSYKNFKVVDLTQNEISDNDFFLLKVNGEFKSHNEDTLIHKRDIEKLVNNTIISKFNIHYMKKNNNYYSYIQIQDMIFRNNNINDLTSKVISEITNSGKSTIKSYDNFELNFELLKLTKESVLQLSKPKEDK